MNARSKTSVSELTFLTCQAPKNQTVTVRHRRATPLDWDYCDVNQRATYGANRTRGATIDVPLFLLRIGYDEQPERSSKCREIRHIRRHGLGRWLCALYFD